MHPAGLPSPSLPFFHLCHSIILYFLIILPPPKISLICLFITGYFCNQFPNHFQITDFSSHLFWAGCQVRVATSWPPQVFNSPVCRQRALISVPQRFPSLRYRVPLVLQFFQFCPWIFFGRPFSQGCHNWFIGNFSENKSGRLNNTWSGPFGFFFIMLQGFPPSGV